MGAGNTSGASRSRRHGNGETEIRRTRCEIQPYLKGPGISPPIPVVLDSAGRARQRVLALFLPIAAALYISAEAVNPRGTDQPITSRATALKELPIAAHHPAQLFVSGSLTLLALGALAVSYAAIATLVRNRGSAIATIAALIGGIGALRLLESGKARA